MIDLKHISLLDVMPPNLLQDEKVKAAAKSLDSELQTVTEQIKHCLLLARLDDLDEKTIDELAWQYHVDFYQPLGMSLESKRDLVRKSIETHRLKGTPYAVEQVVSAAFNRSSVQEWFEYGGDPYRFKITTSGFKDKNSTAEHLMKAINSVKNTRSHLDGITIDINPDKDLEKNKLKYSVGIVNITAGKKQINLPNVPDCQQKIYTSIGYLRAGKVGISTARPPKMSIKIYVGTLIRRTGKITIGGIR